MIQKNGKTLNQNRVFGWVGHYFPIMLGTAMEAEFVELLSEAVGYGKCRPSPEMQDAMLQRAAFYARSAHLLEKYQIERNTEAALRDFQSMLRKACKYFNCDDQAKYKAVCEYGIKVPRHGAVKVIETK